MAPALAVCGAHLAEQEGAVGRLQRRHGEAVALGRIRIAEVAKGDEARIVGLKIGAAKDPVHDRPAMHQQNLAVEDRGLAAVTSLPMCLDRRSVLAREGPGPRLEPAIDLVDRARSAGPQTRSVPSLTSTAPPPIVAEASATPSIVMPSSIDRGAAHLVALLDAEDVLARRQIVELRDDAGEGRDRRARRRILADARRRARTCAHGKAERSSRVWRRVDKGRAEAARGRRPRARRARSRPMRPMALEIAHRHERKGHAGAEGRRVMVLEADIGGIETERRGDKRARRRSRPPRPAGAAGRSGRRPPWPASSVTAQDTVPIVSSSPKRYEPSAPPWSSSARRTAVPTVGCPAKGISMPGREDAQAGPMLGVLRRAGRTPSPRG